MRSRAALLHSYEAGLEPGVIEVDDPRESEVRVRIEVVGLCASDWAVISGAHRRATPAVLGHEAVGVVESVGPAVVGLVPGDRVVTSIAGYCGVCAACARGDLTLCDRARLARSPDARPRLRVGDVQVSAGFGIGAFSELVLLDERAVVKVAQDLPPAVASMLGCAVLTGIGAVTHTAQVKRGDTVAIFGCGGVGLNVVQGARLAGAGRIVAFDPNPARRELALEFGAHSAHDSACELDGLTVDYAFEVTGKPQVALAAFGMTREGGTTVLVGMAGKSDIVELPMFRLLRGRHVCGSIMGNGDFQVDVPAYADLYRAGVLDLDQLVGPQIGLDEIEVVYRTGTDACGAGRPAVVFG